MLKIERYEADQVAGGASAYLDVLAQEMLERGYCIRSKVHGQSMYPFIQNGYTVVVEPKSRTKFSIGDIVFYRRPWGTYVVHRLIRKENGSLITKGDNRFDCDEPVPFEQVLGRVIQIEGRGKRVSLQGGVSQALGWLSAWLAGAHSPTQTRLTRHLGRLYWLIGGRRTT